MQSLLLLNTAVTSRTFGWVVVRLSVPAIHLQRPFARLVVSCAIRNPVRQVAPPAMSAFTAPLPVASTTRPLSTSICGTFQGVPGALPIRRVASRRTIVASLTTERGATFSTDGRFYRARSAVVRDLGVLAARAHTERLARPLRVLDACSGSGVRSLRYLMEGAAGFVWANDAQTQESSVLAENFCGVLSEGRAKVSVATLEDVFQEVRGMATDAVTLGGEGEGSLEDVLFDLVDLDVFGACTSREMGLALDAVNPNGGLLYLSSTDSVSAAGHNKMAAEKAWGIDLKPHPAVNEQFLRVIIGTCARVAAEKGLEIKPVFSFFHSVSSTARVMVRVKAVKEIKAPPEVAEALLKRAERDRKDPIGYVSHCHACGANAVVKTAEAANATCGECGAEQGNGEYVVSGPMWVGRMQNVDSLRQMRALARGLADNDSSWMESHRAITKLVDEANEAPMYYRLGDISKRIGASAPPRQRIVDELARLGFTSSAAHCRPKCIKTSAPYKVLLDATRTAVEDVKAMMAAAATTGNDQVD